MNTLYLRRIKGNQSPPCILDVGRMKYDNGFQPDNYADYII